MVKQSFLDELQHKNFQNKRLYLTISLLITQTNLCRKKYFLYLPWKISEDNTIIQSSQEKACQSWAYSSSQDRQVTKRFFIICIDFLSLSLSLCISSSFRAFCSGVQFLVSQPFRWDEKGRANKSGPWRNWRTGC